MDTHEPVTDSNVEEALSAVLLDDKFAAAPQMSAFLKYVVTQTLYEDPSRIKAYTVAVDALGKPPTFDPQNDPSVRVLAKRLRGSLDTYYENNPDVEVVIEMKAGSYVPHFVRREAVVPTELTPQTTDLQSNLTAPSAPIVASAQPTNPAALALARATAGEQHLESKPAPGVVAKPGEMSATVQLAMAKTNDASSSVGLASEHSTSIGEPAAASAQVAVPALLHTQAADNADAVADTDTHFQIKEKRSPVSDDVNTAETNSAQVTIRESANSSYRKGPGIIERFRAIPRPAIVMGLCAGLVWFAMADGQDSDRPVPLGAAMPIADLSSQSEPQPEFRPRPDKLTIVGVDLSTDTPLGRSVVNTVSTVVSRFDHVDLHRQHDLVGGSQRWPEDYQIHLHVATVSGRSEINVQLIHAKSSRIAYSETLNLQSEANSELSDADYIRVQNSAARWMQSDGPIIRDYHSNASSRTEEMACYISVIAIDLHTELKPAQAGGCGSLANESETDTESTIVYRAWKMLTDTDKSESAVAASDPGLSLETAAKAVELSPYNGYAHISLAMAQELVGDLDGSVRSVENAMKLNPLDANILKYSASISENNGDAEQAAQWRMKAAQLSLGMEFSTSVTDQQAPIAR